MKIISRAIPLAVLIVALSSCSAFAAAPTATLVPTATSAPTSTYTPQPTAAPTETPVPPSETPAAPDLQMPTGKPAANWEGFPIMPGALAGEGDSKGYTFTVKATAEAVQQFYSKALLKLGWNMFAGGQGSTGALLLIFMKGADTVTMSIIPQPDGIMYVLLVK